MPGVLLFLNRVIISVVSKSLVSAMYNGNIGVDPYRWFDPIKLVYNVRAYIILDILMQIFKKTLEEEHSL